MLAAAESQEASALAAKDDAGTRAKSLALDLAFAGETRGPVQRSAARPQRVNQSAPDQAAADQSARHRPDDTGVATDRKGVVSGKSESVRVDLGGRRIIKKTINITIHITTNKKKTINKQ